MPTSSLRFAPLAIALLLALVACSPNDATESTTTPLAEGSDACNVENLTLMKAGTLTLGADQPAYPPWFEDNDPANGKGYEGAVAAAVATEMGFESSQVTWVAVPFNKSFAPGRKDFDAYITQVSITPKRAEVVDFSAAYYNAAQALVTLKKSPFADATTVAELADANLGAQIGSTSLTTIDEQIQPTQSASVYDSNNDAKSALQNGQIDGIVVDLPTAFYMTAVQIPDATIAGQFPPTSGEPEQFGMVLEKGSPLLPCLDQAITSLTSDGTLAELEQQWLADETNVPVFS